MKRVFDEISDDEWENHSFKPSRVFRTSKIPPPIESFAYGSVKQDNSDRSADNSFEIKENWAENLEDDDVEVREARPNRCRRFVVDEDSDDDFAEVIEVKSTEESSELGFEDEEVEEEVEVEADDVVGKALRKCAKISAELRRELYGSSSAGACDRYAEVEASSVRIATQSDIDAACGIEDSDFQPVLKPYQLVGVNFLLLLYRKRIGGAILADEMGLGKTIQELWSLLEFMMPDIFQTGDVDLKKLLNAEDRDLIGRMKSILGPFILRRLKSDVMQQLVPKIQQVEFVKMEKQQEDAYKEAIEEYRAASRARIAKFSDVKCDNVVGILPQRQISNYFVQFRKIANHPLLVRRIYTDEDVVHFARKLHPKGVFGYECTLDRVIDELKSYNDFTIHRLLLSYGGTDINGILSDEHVMVSAKCLALANLLPSLEQGGHRVLIFSQWTSMLDILEWTLDVIGVTHRRLDGSTQVTERQTIVDTFNNDTSIFACLLSTRAGGQGLNLTGADTVIIHDMDFNPQIDRQAEDRCHRIGQNKPVTIYRLVTKDTVDENIYEIAKRKLVLDAAVLESGVEVDNESHVSDMTMGEILSTLLLG